MQQERTPLKGGESKGWNYSNPNKDNYLECLEGTVIEFSKPQHTNFQTKEPEFWSNGEPKLDWQFTILGRSGKELNWRFSPGSATKPKAPRRALTEAMETIDAQYVEDILGKFVRIRTQAGTYNMQNPRPWFVEILGEGETDKVRGVKSVAPVQNQHEVNRQGAQAALNAVQQGAPIYTDEDIPF